VGLRLADDHSELLRTIEPELRRAAEAMGMGVRAQLLRLAPALTRPPQDAPQEWHATLTILDLDHEGAPDPLSLAACLAAHRAYVGARGEPEGVSAGALALARLLVWAQRAAMLGAVPRIEWIGPAPRRPEADGRLSLSARCALELTGRTRRAEAVALISAPSD
jgi:hypothetical protein